MNIAYVLQHRRVKMNYTPEHEQAWNRAIKLLEENLPSFQFNTWIKPLRLHAVTPNTIVIIVDNQLTMQ